MVELVGADIVLLQEVDSVTERSGFTDQLGTLKAATGYHGAFGRTLDYQGGGYGIAVLSRWPIVRDTLIPLPVDPPPARAGGSREPRGVLEVRIALPGDSLTVLNTHLDASRDDAYRRQEIRTLMRRVRELTTAGERVLIGGDFNSLPESEVQRELRAAGWRDLWTVCGTGSGFTFPDTLPSRRIDYLYDRGDFVCAAASVLDSQASDHRAVLFSLESR